MDRMTRRSEAPSRGTRRRSRTRGALIEAAQRLFASRPFESVTIDHIVEDADVAKGSFYNHFDDKDALAHAIYQGLSEDVKARLLANIEGIADPVERLAWGMCTVIRYAHEHPDSIRSLIELFVRRSGADDPTNAGLVAEVRAALAHGRASGVDERTGMLIVYGLSVATLRHAAGAPPCELSDLAVTMTAAMLRAIGVPSADSRTIASDAAGHILNGVGA